MCHFTTMYGEDINTYFYCVKLFLRKINMHSSINLEIYNQVTEDKNIQLESSVHLRPCESAAGLTGCCPQSWLECSVSPRGWK